MDSKFEKSKNLNNQDLIVTRGHFSGFILKQYFKEPSLHPILARLI